MFDLKLVFFWFFCVELVASPPSSLPFCFLKSELT